MSKRQFSLVNLISALLTSIVFLLFFNKKIFLFYLFGTLTCAVNLLLWKILIEQLSSKKLSLIDLLIFVTFKIFIIFSIFLLINAYKDVFVVPAIIAFIMCLFLVTFMLCFYHCFYHSNLSRNFPYNWLYLLVKLL